MLYYYHFECNEKSGTLRGHEITQISHFVRNDKRREIEEAGIARLTYNPSYRAAATAKCTSDDFVFERSASLKSS